MSIIEKLGIKPLKKHGLSFPSKIDHQFNEKSVREIEQQRNELLEALISQVEIQYSDNGEYACVCDETLMAIQNADPQHRPWSKIKELI